MPRSSSSDVNDSTLTSAVTQATSRDIASAMTTRSAASDRICSSIGVQRCLRFSISGRQRTLSPPMRSQCAHRPQTLSGVASPSVGQKTVRVVVASPFPSTI
jgi:hypothetical protein